MSAHNILMAAAGSAGADKLYVDDVFSAYTYTGNGTNQTINNGIDLAGKGGMVWFKQRGDTISHALVNTVLGGWCQLSTDRTDAQAGAANDWDSFTSSGFNLKAPNFNYFYNQNTREYISWTFRKAPKFFDVVTYTGNGSTRTISHGLGQVPGMIIIKSSTWSEGWQVWHRSLAADQRLILQTASGAETVSVSPPFWGSGHTSSAFSLGSWNEINSSGAQYVAYLFAHDPSADGIVQCGSATTDGSGNATVSLGWEPQYILVKRTDSTSDWMVYDTARDFSYANQKRIRPNLSDAEGSNSTVRSPTATGFSLSNGAYATYIYLAIRRPNKPPTTGTQVYNAIARTGTGAAATVNGVGFAPDAIFYRPYNVAIGSSLQDRLRGGRPRLKTTTTEAEALDNELDFGVTMDGVRILTPDGVINFGSFAYINHFFRRAPGFFDVVCYTGDSSSNRYISHSLGVTPELVIVKQRSSVTQWYVSHKDFGGTTHNAYLNLANAKGRDYEFSTNDSPHTASAFIVSGGNTNSGTCVAYLFASLPGISKVGSYTGNGSSQTINCGFAAGARFILIKRTDSTGDWFVWDTARGIVSANDPHLSLNTTAAEVTTNDSVDPDSTGFIVNQDTATNINVTGATYIHLAIA